MAVGDELIPSEEQEVYRAAGYGRPRGFGSRAALLVVDVEYNFTGEAPEPLLDAIAKFKDSCGTYAWAAIPHIRRLLDLARQAGLPVFFTHGLPKASPAGGPDRGTTIVEELKPDPKDVVIPKAAPSAFFGTRLASYLIGEWIDTVIVTGCTTSGCVRATVVDSYSYRFHTVVPVEAVFDRAETSHRVNLFDMAMKYAHVVPVREVEAWLAARAGRGDSRSTPAPAYRDRLRAGEPGRTHMLDIALEIDGVVARAVLFEDRAPRTCARVRNLLPIEDRTIQVRWSGAAWRTEKNYPLKLGEVENPVTVLEPGDIIYYDDPRYDLYKIGVAYGRAAWRDFAGDLRVAHIGRITDNLDAFVKACDRIIFDGPRAVRISLAG